MRKGYRESKGLSGKEKDMAIASTQIDQLRELHRSKHGGRDR